MNTLRVHRNIFESGKKKLWIKKCPDTCGQGPSKCRYVFLTPFCKKLCRGISMSDFASFDSYDYFSEGNAYLIDSQILNACHKQ